VGHVVKEFTSKLKPMLLLLLLLLLKLLVDEDEVEDPGDRASKVEANEKNMGLLAIVVYGAFEAKPEPGPNPKSIWIAPSVAVG